MKLDNTRVIGSDFDSPRARFLALAEEDRRYQFHPTAKQFESWYRYGFMEILTDERIEVGKYLMMESHEYDRRLMINPLDEVELKKKLLELQRETRAKKK